jgi:hypothetical protein
MNDRTDMVEREHCNKCLQWNNHAIVHTEKTSWQEELDDQRGIYIEGGDSWALMRCLGCDSVRLRHRHWFSEDSDEHGQPAIYTEFFPPSITRQKPQWRRQAFPFNAYLQSYNGLCDEIYGAMAIGAHRLATMGIRVLVERLMIDQVGDQGRFEKNIEKFFGAGHVAPNQQAMFKDTLIEAGHAAMHRDFEPSADTVSTLLDTVEGILHAIYYAPMLADKVRKTIPPRVR